MAILGSLEASVSINGNKAQEYDDPKSDDTANVVSKYIEVAAGANFSLALTVKQEPPLDCDCISWSVYLDGDPKSKKRIHTKRLRKRQEPGKDVTQVIEGKTVGDDRGNYSLSKFRFGDLVINDDDETLSSLPKKRVQYLGTISIKVYRCKEGETYVPKNSKIREPSADNQGEPVPEKALKGRAITLSAGLDAPVRDTTQYRKTSTSDLKKQYVMIDSHPIAVFEFKYRSRKALHDEWIIPRSPTPVPVKERPIEELSVEEARELLRRQNEKQLEQEKVKREIKQEDSMAGTKHQRSESNTTPPRAYKVARSEEEIEVVNLADDDDDATAAPTTAATSFASTLGVGTIVDLEDFVVEEQ